MRIRGFSGTALAAAAIFHGAGAQVPVAQAGASSDDITSVLTTWTLTRTVERVVETVTATKDNMTLTSLATTSITTLASASMTLTPYMNGTASVLGTGASPTATASESILPMPTNGAGSIHGLDVLGYAAIAGVMGLVVT